MKNPTSLVLLLLFLISLTPSVFSQDFQNKYTKRLGCSTPPMTKLQREYTLNVVDKVSAKRNTGTTCFPIRIHRVTEDDGMGGIGLDAISKGVANLNNFYLEAGIQFYIASINTIPNSEWYEFSTEEEEAYMTSANSIYDAVNIYFVNSISIYNRVACGYAYFPNDTTNSLNMLMDNSCLLNQANGTFVHEFGHFFNLAHTHQYTGNGNTDANAESVSRNGENKNCDTNGDLLCDTAADPDGSNDNNCNFINDGTSTTDIYGLTYTPDIDNIMSYYTDRCGGIFTPGQYTRIANGLATRLSHTNYTIEASPSIVNAATELTAMPNNSYGIDLTWTDNAANELGYLIERSSDGGLNWISVLGGGVGPNISSFTDFTVKANTSYKYRIKASNSSCNDYSNETAFIDTGLMYCVPTHQYNSCSPDPNNDGIGVAIYNLQLDGDGAADINNLNNGCEAALSIFSNNHSANVTAAESYEVILDFKQGDRFILQFITIWMDVNQDGDFEDSNEMLYQSDLAQSSFIAPITIPETAINGPTTMRLRSGWSAGGQISSPCGYWAFSETEDYELIVTEASLTAPTIAFDEVALVDLIKVYPNPVVNELFIKAKDTKIKQLILYDILGRVIKNNKQNIEKIDSSSLKSGMYLLEVKTNRGRVFYRILKK